MIFLYTRVNGRLCPSIRHQLKTDGHGKNVDKINEFGNGVVFKVEIEHALPLNVLMKMYPMEEKE